MILRLVCRVMQNIFLVIKIFANKDLFNYYQVNTIFKNKIHSDYTLIFTGFSHSKCQVSNLFLIRYQLFGLIETAW